MPPIVIASIAMCVGTTIIHGQNQLFFSCKQIRQKYAYKCFSISACWKTENLERFSKFNRFSDMLYVRFL